MNMQLVILAFVATLASAQAQCSISDLPSCALTPAVEAISTTGCGTDLTCVCNHAAFFAQLNSTVKPLCSAADYQATTGVIQCICAQAGVFLTIASSSPSSAPATTVLNTPSLATASTTNFRSTSSGSTASSTTSSTRSAITYNTSSASNNTAEASQAPSISGGALTSGAKAGIGIGAALAFIAILAAFFCLNQRKRQHEKGLRRDLEVKDDIAMQTRHELITVANTHEIDSDVKTNERKIDVQELESPKSQTVIEMSSTNVLPMTGKIPTAVEMPASLMTYTTNVGSDWERFQLNELNIASPIVELPSQPTHLESSCHRPQPTPALTPNFSESQHQYEALYSSLAAPPLALNATQVEGKLSVLRKRIEQVQEEKERLEKIQQLKELEAGLQREIMEEQRKAAGFVGNDAACEPNNPSAHG